MNALETLKIGTSHAHAEYPATAPATHSTDDGVFARERDRLFRRAWLSVARVEEVPKPNDFVRFTIPTTATAGILIRGDDGILRAFHNRCSHRGVALVCEDRGNATGFRCPYHAWMYGTDGALRGIPDAGSFRHVDRAANGLKPIACETWNGFVFVNLSQDPIPLSDFLGSFGEEFGAVPFHDYASGIAMSQTVSGNWKGMIDASGEGYHISSLHRSTLHPQVAVPENPFQGFYDPRYLGLHSTATLGRNSDWMPTTPVARFVLETILQDYMEDMRRMAAKTGIAGGPTVNRIDLPNFQIEAITLFPNSLIQIIPNGYLWMHFWPTAPGRTETSIRLYGRKTPQTHRELFAAAHVRAQARDIITEDIAMVELQQIGLESDPDGRQIFGDSEYLLRRFNTLVDDFIQADDLPNLLQGLSPTKEPGQ